MPDSLSACRRLEVTDPLITNDEVLAVLIDRHADREELGSTAHSCEKKVTPTQLGLPALLLMGLCTQPSTRGVDPDVRPTRAQAFKYLSRSGAEPLPRSAITDFVTATKVRCSAVAGAGARGPGASHQPPPHNTGRGARGAHLPALRPGSPRRVPPAVRVSMCTQRRCSTQRCYKHVSVPGFRQSPDGRPGGGAVGVSPAPLAGPNQRGHRLTRRPARPRETRVSARAVSQSSIDSAAQPTGQ
jgi:hypothetical protein